MPFEGKGGGGGGRAGAAHALLEGCSRGMQHAHLPCFLRLIGIPPQQPCRLTHPPPLPPVLQAAGVVPVLYASQWLLTCYSCPFPVSFACRIVDVMLQASGGCCGGGVASLPISGTPVLLPQQHSLTTRVCLNACLILLFASAGEPGRHSAQAGCGHPGRVRGRPADAGGEAGRRLGSMQGHHPVAPPAAFSSKQRPQHILPIGALL